MTMGAPVAHYPSSSNTVAISKEENQKTDTPYDNRQGFLNLITRRAKSISFLPPKYKYLAERQEVKLLFKEHLPYLPSSISSFKHM